MNQVEKIRSNDSKLGEALRYYFNNFTGPHRGGMPDQPSAALNSVKADGTVILRNAFRVLAKLRVNDDDSVEELEFNPYEEEKEDDDGDAIDSVSDSVHDSAEVINRLRCIKEKQDEKDYKEGRSIGIEWAKKKAEPREMLRLSGIDLSHCQGRDGEFDRDVLCSEIDPHCENADEFWDYVTGWDPGHLDDITYDFVRGFIDGALEVWDAIKDKI